MKRFLLAALVASAFAVPQANAGPLRNLIRSVIHRPKPAPAAQVTTAPYVASCSGCQSNSGSGIVWATQTCQGNDCTK